ncbi:uncharacterized protein LOC129961641 [Argiope bruennichi]|uniref:uncharacterized protein LOC129961641 n=1 Tax=Argiope bruennichi TaxID=94029 RepID=UPI002494CCB7|nr:uncharacterized protein LOC129961641 [Argiope bruennichi]
MDGFYFLLIAFVYVGLVSSQRADPSSRRNSALPREDVRKCYNDLEKDSDISHLLLDVTSPESIDQFCGRISRLKQCIANNEHQISNEENTEYLQRTRGISAFYLNVCPPGTDITGVYKGNAPCFQLIKNKILSCGSDLPDMSSYEMLSDHTARCCALSRHRRCILEATGENCGKPAAEVMDQILLRYFRHELNGCQSDSHDACSGRDSGTHVTSEEPDKYHDKDYDTTKGDWEYDMTTDDYERDHNDDDSSDDSEVSSAASMSSFLSSLFVMLLHFVLVK